MKAEEQEFLHEIEVAPHAIDRRLIYADWLEEKGDPRAEFIQLWHEMRSLKPWSEKYSYYASRLRSLRGGIDKRWLDRLGYDSRYQLMLGELPSDRPSCWRLLTTFLECWYQPLADLDRVSQSVLKGTEWRIGQKLPATLKEWYQHSGYARNVWFRPGPVLIEPGELLPDSRQNRLPIIEVNRSDHRLQQYHWPMHFGCSYALRLSDLAMDDPPVYWFGNAGSSGPTGLSLSIFILFWAVHTTVLCAPTHRWLVTTGRPGQYIGDDFPRAEFPEVSIEGTSVTIFEGADVLGVFSHDSVRLCSHSTKAASPVLELVPPTDVWNRVDEQWVPHEERHPWPDEDLQSALL